MKPQIIFDHYAPVAIGGVGGSGTRLVASVLEDLGYHMGSDFNEARDNLWYALLFVRIDVLRLPRDDLLVRVELFINAMIEGREISQLEHDLIRELADAPVPHGPLSDTKWLHKRAELLVKATTERRHHYRGRWGWKQPNTHIILDRLNEIMPQLKYIHVARNGLDLAYSRNQNQLKLWGPHLLGINSEQIDAYHSLKWWCHVHRRIFEIGRRMGNRFFFLNYDDLCANPHSNLRTLCSFLGIEVDPDEIDRLASLVEPPSSMGQFRAHDRGVFDPDEINYVASLGFDTHEQAADWNG